MQTEQTEQTVSALVQITGRPETRESVLFLSLDGLAAALQARADALRAETGAPCVAVKAAVNVGGREAGPFASFSAYAQSPKAEPVRGGRTMREEAEDVVPLGPVMLSTSIDGAGSDVDIRLPAGETMGAAVQRIFDSLRPQVKRTLWVRLWASNGQLVSRDLGYGEGGRRSGRF